MIFGIGAGVEPMIKHRTHGALQLCHVSRLILDTLYSHALELRNNNAL